MAINFKPCSVASCNGNAAQKMRGRQGFCNKHYLRFMRHGSPTSGASERAAFGEPVTWLQNSTKHKSDECLDWPFGKYPNGYGAVMIEGVKRGAHRVMCEMVHGSPPSPKMETAHNCGRAICVNPAHLRWDTRAGNHADKLLHGTSQRGENCGRSKLTEDEVRSIRRLIGVYGHREIGNMYGVAARTVFDIAHRRSWNWLD